VQKPLVIVHPQHGEATVSPADWAGSDPRLNAAFWQGKGWAAKVDHAAEKAETERIEKPKPTFESIVKGEWRPAFVAANLGTLEAVAAALPDDLNALPVKGLGAATAAKLVEAAQAALKAVEA